MRDWGGPTVVEWNLDTHLCSGAVDRLPDCEIAQSGMAALSLVEHFDVLKKSRGEPPDQYHSCAGPSTHL